MTSIGIIICTESGKLEKKSRLFVKSLREFGGSLSSANIYSISPRKRKTDLSKKTIDCFKQFKVNHLAVGVNQSHANYNMANKIYAAAYYESQLNEKTLIFCDSDLLVLGNLDRLLISKEYDAALRVVARKNTGTNGEDENASYWHKLYEVFGVKQRAFIHTALGEKIYPYYDGGLIAVKRELGFFGQWRKNFEYAMSIGIHPPKGLYFLEQTLIAVTLMQMQLKVKELPLSYNYPIFRHSDLRERKQELSLNQIKILHYHKAFDQPLNLSLGKELKGLGSPRIKWIEEQLQLEEINPNPFVHDAHYDFFCNPSALINRMKK